MYKLCGHLDQHISILSEAFLQYFNSDNVMYKTSASTRTLHTTILSNTFQFLLDFQVVPKSLTGKPWRRYYYKLEALHHTQQQFQRRNTK